MFEQTDPDWNPDLESDRRGTGVFVPPRPRGAPAEKELVKDMTYRECVQHARTGNYRLFKWVPNDVESYDSLRLARCAGGPCRTARDCFQTVCFCDGGQCI